MKRKERSCILWIGMFLLGTSLYGQEVNAIIKDSLTLEPVPYASIYFKKGKGIIANEEGFFRMQYDSLIKESDSLFFSCMGYKTIGFPLEELKDSIVYLPSQSIALNSIVLSNKIIKADQIIKAIKENIAEKYELDYTQKKMFFRESGSQKFNQLDVTIKKSSIPEFNQAFWDSTLRMVPKYNEWYTEVLGSWYGSVRDKKHKLVLEKALELEDKKTTAVFENIEKLFDTILKENVKTNSYLKVRTGLLGTKIKADEVVRNSEIDTLTTHQKDSIKKTNFSNRRKQIISSQFRLFEDEKLNIRILKKASKYLFEITDFTYLGDTPVYILSFKPKGSADYQGKLFVDADQMALIRIEYKNIQNLRDFSLLGLSFKLTLREVVLQFKKMGSEKYTLEYMEYASRFQSGVDRSLVITEKNKIVKGRNKQNQLKMDLKMTNEQYNKFQIIVFQTLPINQKKFEDLKETARVLPVNLTQYDPKFWEGYSIIEPNAAIKSYKAKR
jgi:hypothetical protein